MIYAAFASTSLLSEFSHIIKIYAIVNYGYNTFRLHLIQYIIQYKIIKLYARSTNK
jgi:hypothetical protein